MQKIEYGLDTILALYERPLFELVHQSYTVHKMYFDPRHMELCTLASIKTGSCPEDCAYCPQSAHYKTGLKKEKLLIFDEVIKLAKQAKRNGAKRFCMGAAWRKPPEKDFPKVLAMVKAVKKLGLETCTTLGMVNQEQAKALKEAGLDFYNHNLDSSPKFYNTIITTRSYQDRLDTLSNVARFGINVCCGGIVGMGESRKDRVELLLSLRKLPKAPASIPINKLIRVKGTPLEQAKSLDDFEIIKTIAVTRILFPRSVIRLSAGRTSMSDMVQAWCFMAGANSIFIGDKLLTADNPTQTSDLALLKRLSYKVPNELHTVQSC